MASQHTPGPWTIRDGSFIDGEGFACLAHVRAAHVPHEHEAIANARLIATSPDHALICWALCAGAGRWEGWDAKRGEFCINGMRYSTKLDEFGCPIVTDLMREAILTAKGHS